MKEDTVGAFAYGLGIITGMFIQHFTGFLGSLALLIFCAISMIISGLAQRYPDTLKKIADIIC